jgi:hypothetical protein
MVASLVAVTIGPGCQPTEPLIEAGISLSVPATWHPAERTRWMVPGEPLAAWNGPEGSSLVVYRTLPAPGATPGAIAEGLANRLMNLPELKVLAKGTEVLAGQPAARVEVVAPGFGDALAPSGVGMPTAIDGKTLVPTHEVIVGFQRAAGLLYLTCRAPEASYAKIAPDLEAVLGSLRLSADPPPSSSSYSN